MMVVVVVDAVIIFAVQTRLIVARRTLLRCKCVVSMLREDRYLAITLSSLKVDVSYRVMNEASPLIMNT